MKRVALIMALLMGVSVAYGGYDGKSTIPITGTVTTTPSGTQAVTGTVSVSSADVSGSTVAVTNTVTVGTHAVTLASTDVSGSTIAVTNTPTVTVGTEPSVAQIPWLTAVAMGQVSGYSRVNKFGHNHATTTGEDIWGGGGLYAFYPAAAQAVLHDGASAADDAAGTGVQSIVYYGLDANWLLANETVATDGTTAVALTNTYVRMFRGISGAVGAYGKNLGIMTVTNSAGTEAISINADDGQTQQAIYTVPAGKTAMIFEWSAGISDSGNSASRESAKFQILTRANGCSWLVKGEAECINDGDTHYNEDHDMPIGPLTAKTDIRIHCAYASTSMGTVGRFCILLKDD